MNITIVQANLKWEDPKANYDNLQKIVGEHLNTDLVILPEMFTTGFSMQSKELSEDTEGETLEWMRIMASHGKYGITGSYIVKEKNSYYNRLVFVKPDGTYSSYDKGHLFRMEKEDQHFSKGNEKLIENFRGININFQICYDLRFPVWTRNRDNEYDLLIYVANWPESRRKVWKTLLVARALENQCFVAGVNRVGTDGTGIFYSGDSVLIDPRGTRIAKVKPYTEGLATFQISIDDLRSFRAKFPVWKDADSFTLD